MNKKIKGFLKISIISLCITLVLCMINFLLVIHTDFLIGIEMHGGEITTTMGLGILKNKFYPETAIDKVESSISESIEFDIISFVMTLLIVFTIFIVLKYVLKKLNNKEITKE